MKRENIRLIQKRIIWILSCLYILINQNIQSQTYTASPFNIYGDCPSSDIPSTTCGFSYYGRTIQMKVSRISGNQITFEIKKCAVGTFGAGTMYIKGSTSSIASTILCSTNYPSSGFSVNTLSTGTYTMTADFATGTKYFSAMS